MDIVLGDYNSGNPHTIIIIIILSLRVRPMRASTSVFDLYQIP